jgi:hypothetical protein
MRFILFVFLISFVSLNSFGQVFTNASFESWGSPTVCETNTPPDGWSDYSNVGLAPDEANFPLCATTIPSSAFAGDVYARCLSGNPTTGEGMFQIVHNFTIGNPYMITYHFCGSNRWGGSGDCVWHLFIDDVDVNQSMVFSSSDTIWHLNTFSFRATQLSHKIGVRAYTPTFNGGGSAAIDLFMIEASSTLAVGDLDESEITVGPNPFDNNLILIHSDQLNAPRILLLNLTGQIVIDAVVSDSRKISTGFLPPAVYVYQIRSDNKIIKQGKIVKII